MLAAAPMQEQKQMLGERLFPLIQVARAQDNDVSLNCSIVHLWLPLAPARGPRRKDHRNAARDRQL